MSRLFFLMLGLALGAVIPSVFAADQPLKAPIHRTLVSASYTWSGFYIGGHLGGGWGDKLWIDDGSVTAVGIGQASYNVSGVLGGGQAGFNIQQGAVVWGVEATASATNIRGGGGTCYQSTGLSQTCSTAMDWIATVNGRVGWAVDRALLYAKGGFAWSRERHDNPLVSFPVAAFATETRSGWTVGAGIEYALAASWSARLDYSYVDFGTRNQDFFLQGGEFSFSADIRQRLNLLTLGVNYRFKPAQ